MTSSLSYCCCAAVAAENMIETDVAADADVA